MRRAFLFVLVAAAGASLAGQQLPSVYQRVLKPDIVQTAAIENVGFRWDALQFALARGQMGLAAPVNDRVLVATFTGNGTLTVVPPTAGERQQMELFRHQDHLEIAFSAAIFRFAESRFFLQALGDQVHFHAADGGAGFASLLAERAAVVDANGLSEGVRLLAALAAPPSSAVAGALLQAELKTDAGWVEAVYDPLQPEPVLVHNPGQRQLYTANVLTRLSQWDPMTADAPAASLAAVDNDASTDPGAGIESLLASTQPGDTIRTGMDDIWTQFASPNAPPPRTAWTLGDTAVDTQLLDPTNLSGDLGLAATAQFPLTAVSDIGAGALFTLDSQLRVSAVTVDGAAAGFLQPRDPGRLADPGYRGNWLYVGLPHPLAADQNAAVSITYAAPRILQRRGPGNFDLLALNWYPRDFFGPPVRRTALDLRFRVGHNYTVVATGTRIRNEHQGNGQLTEWKTAEPLPAAGFTVGDFKELDSSLALGDSQLNLALFVGNRPDNVIDTINTAERNVQNPKGRSLKPSGPPAEGTLTVGNLPPQQRSIGEIDPTSNAAHALEEISNALRFLENYFGPFPFPQLTVTGAPIVDTDSQPVSNMLWDRLAPPSQTPGRDGPNWPSLFSITNLFFLDQTQLHVINSGNNGIRNVPGENTAASSGGIAGPDVNFERELIELLPAHEAAHQWWGDRVGWATPRDQWLSEGFANASALLYEENRFGISHAQDTLRHWRSELTHPDLYARVPIDDGALWLGPRLASTADPMGYEIVTYDKGGYVVYMLRQMLRDPRQANPDAAFIAMMRDFASTWAGRNATTRDFQACVEKHMTPAMNLDGDGTMNWFFNDYVYGAGLPTLTFKSVVQPTGSGSTVSITVGNPGHWRGLLPVYLFESPTVFQRAEVQITQEQQTIAMKLPYIPASVDANHFQDMLLQIAP